MRKDDGGRTALLRDLRQNIRRKALPASAHESARRGGLLEVRQPRTLDAATQDSDESATACHPGALGSRPLALLCVPQPRHCSHSHAAGTEGLRRLWDALGRPLVALVEAARLVPRSHSVFLEK